MAGVLVNSLAVLLGGLLGCLCGRRISEKYVDCVMQAIGLCVLVIGFRGVLVEMDALAVLAAMIIGGALGTRLDLEGRFAALGGMLERALPRAGDAASLTQGFLSASLVVSVGSMGILGAIQAGTTGDCTLLYTKALLDFTTVLFLAVSMGVGAALSGISVLAVQSVFVVLARVLQPLMTETVLLEIGCVGSVLMIALGLNLLHLTKLKLLNLLPAVAVAPMAACLLRLF